MKPIEEYCVSPSDNLRQVIETIDQAAAQIALVVDNEGRLVGTVTDGDIRRAILRGKSLDTRIDEAMHRGFKALNSGASEKEALSLMKQHGLHQIPAIDSQGRVTRLFLLEDLLKPKHFPNPVVIMAGGLGNRLGKLTSDCPKPMLKIQGKPILEIILKQCIDSGFRRFHFAVNYLKDQIKDHFGNGSAWRVQIDYLEENRPLGTAGALSLLTTRPESPLLVINGDVLTRIDYTRLIRFNEENNASATVCVREHTTEIPYGVVHLNDTKLLAFEEKPSLTHYVNAGIYLIEPCLIDLIPPNTHFDMPQLLEIALQRNHRISAFPVHEYWLDIGLPETLQQAYGDWK